jgi:hypothetical protein
MSEENMVGLMQAALDHHGVEDTIVAAGQFTPRGRSGAMFAGGMLGSTAGDALGQAAGGIGPGLGMLGGAKANAESSTLPAMMLVGVSETAVYGMHARSRRQAPDRIVFAVSRKGLTAKVHQRVNVRVLELIEDATGVRIELEGSRLPITHSKDVMDVLAEPAAPESA